MQDHFVKLDMVRCRQCRHGAEGRENNEPSPVWSAESSAEILVGVSSQYSIDDRSRACQAEQEQPIDELNVQIGPDDVKQRQKPKQATADSVTQVQNHVECQDAEQDRKEPGP